MHGIYSIFTISSLFILFICTTQYSEGFVKKCYKCRSRGELGDCRDPFTHETASIESLRSVEESPCASGWCGKIIEGEEDDYGLATERLCLQRPPSDLLQRCTETIWKRRKVHMCMCKGDLCNKATNIKHSSIFITVLLSLILFIFM